MLIDVPRQQVLIDCKLSAAFEQWDCSTPMSLSKENAIQFLVRVVRTSLGYRSAVPEVYRAQSKPFG
jgi:hypothetical protein